MFFEHKVHLAHDKFDNLRLAGHVLLSFAKRRESSGDLKGAKIYYRRAMTQGLYIRKKVNADAAAFDTAAIITRSAALAVQSALLKSKSNLQIEESRALRRRADESRLRVIDHMYT